LDVLLRSNTLCQNAVEWIKSRAGLENVGHKDCINTFRSSRADLSDTAGVTPLVLHRWCYTAGVCFCNLRYLAGIWPCPGDIDRGSRDGLPFFVFHSHLPSRCDANPTTGGQIDGSRAQAVRRSAFGIDGDHDAAAGSRASVIRHSQDSGIRTGGWIGIPHYYDDSKERSACQ
jgi:hypothetical protein